MLRSGVEDVFFFLVTCELAFRNVDSVGLLFSLARVLDVGLGFTFVDIVTCGGVSMFTSPVRLRCRHRM